MNTRFHSFREQHKIFRYRRVELQPRENSLRVSFIFEIDDAVHFTPTIEFPKPADGWRIDPTGPLATKLAFSIGMVEAISYWKTYCPARMHVQAGALSSEEIAWWRKLYFLGLGEFFHRNEIETSLTEFIEITADDSAPFPPARLERSERNLIPVGGGKDSIVSLELMRPFQGDSQVLLLNAPRAARRCAQTAGYTDDRIIEIRRTLDPQLFKLNAQGALNGHTPFSALLAFASLMAAALGGAGRILLSNESSANEPTVPGSEVNHQYSKSFEFEEDFRRYVDQFITPDVEYLSLLRPFNELQIAAAMTRHPQYLADFRSCNVGSKEDRWCGQCPKCLFTYVMLQPFLEPETLREIFGRDLLDDPTLKGMMAELLGCAETKPFECVGTVAEVRAAVSLILSCPERNGNRQLLTWVGRQHPEVLTSRQVAAATLHEWHTPHHLPPVLEKRLQAFLPIQP